LSCKQLCSRTEQPHRQATTESTPHVTFYAYMTKVYICITNTTPTDICMYGSVGASDFVATHNASHYGNTDSRHHLYIYVRLVYDGDISVFDVCTCICTYIYVYIDA